jgi:hypothetical protein
MQSCTEGLFPFPYAHLSSMFVKSKSKNTYFFTCTHLAYYTACVYASCSTIACVHRDLCQKMKINVGFPCHNRISMILGLPYTRNVLTHPFNSILKAINGPILSYGKRRKEFNFESKVTLEKLFTSY